jgi:pimeloyl-ACP methyl ester carboxylesterase
MTTMTPATGTLDVPGARLHYTVVGRGPLLLTVPGGAADGGMFAALATLLAADRTVVTYDPRGLSASTVADPDAEITVADQAADALALLDALGDGPADVLGSSGGALTALDLVARHPGRIRTLVAHEPPLVYLLPDADEHARSGRAVKAVHRAEGVYPAFAAFLTSIGAVPAGAAPPQEAVAPFLPNFDVFLGRMWDSIGDFRPDVDALRRSGTRIVVAGGAASVGQPAQRAAAAFAEVLGVPLRQLPGDHGGFAQEPAAFAAALNDILAG